MLFCFFLNEDESTPVVDNGEKRKHTISYFQLTPSYDLRLNKKFLPLTSSIFQEHMMPHIRLIPEKKSDEDR